MAKVNLKFDELKKLVWAGAVDNIIIKKNIISLIMSALIMFF